MQPLVSILIPVYKRREMNCETVDCALMQDYKNIEIIICDNCSPDGSYELLKEKYKDNCLVSIYKNERNLGATYNWEQCLSHASGEYIKFLWSDDLISSDHISQMTKMLDEHKESAFVFSPIKTFRDSTEREIVIDINSGKRAYYHIGTNELHIKRNRYFLRNSGEFDGKLFIEGVYTHNNDFPVSPACALFRHECLEITHEIPNKLGFKHWITGAGPDLRMFLNSLNRKGHFCFLNKTVSFFRGHEESITCSDKTIYNGYLIAKLDYLEKYGEKDREDLLDYCFGEILIKNADLKSYNCERANKLINEYTKKGYIISDERFLKIRKCAEEIISIDQKRIKNKLYGRIFINRQ